MYIIMSPANHDSFTSFPIAFLFIALSCLVLASTQQHYLKTSDEDEYCYFVPDLSEKAFSFTPLEMVVMSPKKTYR